MAVEGIVPTEVRAGPDAIRATVREAAEPAADAAMFLRERRTERIFVIGNGTSYHSALAASQLYAHRAGPDDPIVVALTAGQFRTYVPRLGPRDAVLGISASGEFVDVVAVFRDLAGPKPTGGVGHLAGYPPSTRAPRIGRGARRPRPRPGL
jgi:fructoselysine-6-P-deglycase FrlB-like protein